jgi:hypothetical protein
MRLLHGHRRVHGDLVHDAVEADGEGDHGVPETAEDMVDVPAASRTRRKIPELIDIVSYSPRNRRYGCRSCRSRTASSPSSVG